MKGIKQILGTRVYLNIPKQAELKIIVNENTKEELKKEFAKNLNRLEVVGFGDGITNTNMKVGIDVMVDPGALTRGAVIVPISDKMDALVVSMFDIAHIWE